MTIQIDDGMNPQRKSTGQRDTAYYLAKAAEYRTKAEAATAPLLKGALYAIVHEYMSRARELDPTLPKDGKLPGNGK
jgi:hypothetical protein